MLQRGRVDRRRGHVIVRALGVAHSTELPDLEWYDALSWTPEDARFQRQLDHNNRQIERAMKQQATGA
jgi:hypothetical protein